MKLLELCVALFGDAVKISRTGTFRDMIAKKRLDCNDDRVLIYELLNWLGGRGYNKFLDYSLLAIKMNHIFESMKGIPNICWYGEVGEGGDIKDLIADLLWDDRHDLYQNMPYILDEIYKAMDEGPDKDNFWSSIVDAIIQCINVNGTGDVSVNFVVNE